MKRVIKQIDDLTIVKTLRGLEVCLLNEPGMLCTHSDNCPFSHKKGGCKRQLLISAYACIKN